MDAPHKLSAANRWDFRWTNDCFCCCCCCLCWYSKTVIFKWQIGRGRVNCAYLAKVFCVSYFSHRHGNVNIIISSGRERKHLTCVTQNHSFHAQNGCAIFTFTKIAMHLSLTETHLNDSKCNPTFVHFFLFRFITAFGYPGQGRTVACE